MGGTFAHEQRKLAERRAVRLDLHTVGLHRRAECQRRDGGARVRDEDFVIAWAPEFGGRIGFPPPEKNELVLSRKFPIGIGCSDTVPFQRKPNTPF